MKIQYISDFHFEFSDNKDGILHINNEADLLIIPGDLHVGSKIFEYLTYISSKIPVIFVYGNHEFYDKKPINNLISQGKSLFNDNENIHILNRDKVVIDDITFIGATGWPDHSYKEINIVSHNKYNDFYMIDKFAENHKEMGDKDREYIRQEIKNSTTKHNIIITHFLPITECLGKKYKGDFLNPCFSNNWQWIFNYSDKIDYWIHGHSHEYLNITIGDITFCRNPFGYPHKNNIFKTDELIII